MCGGVGTCVDVGCDCEGTADGTGVGGDFCTADQADSESAGPRAAPLNVLLVWGIGAIAGTAVHAIAVANARVQV